MAETLKRTQIVQKLENNNTLLLHPETEAEVVLYDHTESGLSATDVQSAIDEIQGEISSITGGGVVTGVKGDAESTYRIGQVNITAANVGAVPTTTKVNGHALSADVSVTKSDVGLGNVTNDAQVKRTEMGAASGVATLDTNSKVPTSQLPSIPTSLLPVNTASGIAGLDSSGKIGTAQLPDVILGQVLFGGTVNIGSDFAVVTITENARTRLNIPSGYTVHLVDSANSGINPSLTNTYQIGYQASQGVFFIVTSGTSGNAVFPNLPTPSPLLPINVGDWLISTGSAWEKVDNTDAVTSVNGRAGSVSVTSTNMRYDGQTSVADSTHISIKDKIDAVEAAIPSALPNPHKLKVKTGSSSYTEYDGSGASDVTIDKVYAATTADSATNATTATNLANAPSIETPTTGTNANKVAVTAGGKTSAYVTVPYAEKAGELANSRTISLSGDVSGSALFNGSANATISATLANSGVTAGTYSAVTVNAKGLVTAGAQFIEVGTANQTTPSNSLAVGGIFFRDIS